MAETIVIAVGGNSLILDPDHVTVEDQYQAAEQTAHNMLDHIDKGHLGDEAAELVRCHIGDSAHQHATG